MKKLIFCLIVLLALPVVLADVSVTHSYEQKQDGLYVHVIIKTDSVEKFDLGELIPENWQITNWTVNAETQFESVAGEFMGKDCNINHWRFNSITKDTEVVYRISPKQAGNYEIVSVWFYPNGFNMGKMSIKI